MEGHVTYQSSLTYVFPGVSETKDFLQTLDGTSGPRYEGVFMSFSCVVGRFHMKSTTGIKKIKSQPTLLFYQDYTSINRHHHVSLKVK